MSNIWRTLARVQLPTSELPARVAQIRALYEVAPNSGANGFLIG
jgi:hypothetical protein